MGKKERYISMKLLTHTHAHTHTKGGGGGGGQGKIYFYTFALTEVKRMHDFKKKL